MLLHFSIQELTTVKCSGNVQIKFYIIFCANKISCCSFVLQFLYLHVKQQSAKTRQPVLTSLYHTIYMSEV